MKKLLAKLRAVLKAAFGPHCVSPFCKQGGDHGHHR